MSNVIGWIADWLETRAAKKAGKRALAASLPLLEAAGYKVEVVPQGVAYVRDTNLIPFRQRALGDRIGDRGELCRKVEEGR